MFSRLLVGSLLAGLCVVSFSACGDSTSTGDHRALGGDSGIESPVDGLGGGDPGDDPDGSMGGDGNGPSDPLAGEVRIPHRAQKGSTVRLDASRLTGENLSFQWETLSDDPLVTLVDSTSAVASFVVPSEEVEQDDAIPIRLTVTDSAAVRGVYEGTVLVGARFVTVWDPDLNTSIPTTTPAGTIRLPLLPTGDHDMLVDWGDGSSETAITTQAFKNDPTIAEHSYPDNDGANRRYAVSMSGRIDGFSFAVSNSAMRSRLVQIKEWGGVKFGNGGSYFSGCSNLEGSEGGIREGDAPDLSGTTNLFRAFLETGDKAAPADFGLDYWDVSQVTNFQSMFESSAFDGGISRWDVSNATSLFNMFAFSVFNGDISDWDVSQVQSFYGMFWSSLFDGDISGWDVSSGTVFQGMFADSVFTGDVSGWDASNAVNLSYMFLNSSFSGPPIRVVSEAPEDFDAKTSMYDQSSMCNKDTLSGSPKYTAECSW